MTCSSCSQPTGKANWQFKLYAFNTGSRGRVFLRLCPACFRSMILSACLYESVRTEPEPANEAG